VAKPQLIRSVRADGEAKTILRDLADLITNTHVQVDVNDADFASVDEDQQAQALDLVERISALVHRLHKKAAA
jgi:hypothetical protein